MCRKYLFLPGLVMLLMCFSPCVWSQEETAPEQMRDHAAQLMREAGQLQEQGRDELAQRVAAKAKALQALADLSAKQQAEEQEPGEDVGAKSKH